MILSKAAYISQDPPPLPPLALRAQQQQPSAEIQPLLTAKFSDGGYQSFMTENTLYCSFIVYKK